MLFWFFGSIVASMTLFFSSRPRLFVRYFVPREEWRGAVRAFVRNKEYTPGMRAMALLQFGFSAVFGAIGLTLWLVLG